MNEYKISKLPISVINRTKNTIYYRNNKKVKWTGNKTEKRICEFENCTKECIFNFAGETKGLYCFEHKEKNMINIRTKTCLKCNKRPCFNFAGETKGLYCFEHKENNMINIRAKACLKCYKKPCFNFAGEIQGIYCFEHKENNMVDVTHRKCLSCDKRPQFNLPGEKKGVYCFEHKKDNMIDVTHRKCLSCDKRPQFNFSVEKKGIYCFEHKKDNMIDVTHRKCLSCDKRPQFNFSGEKKGIYCFEHKKPEMVDVIAKRCQSIWCDTQVSNQKYKGFCLFCFMHLFPEEKVTRNYKTKERSVVDFILEHFPNFTWIFDKKVEGGCSKRRPDILLDLGEYVIIIEIDENQHIDYNCICETKRLMEISKDIGFRPCVFIRFNPDDFFDKNKKNTSCWGCNKNGILTVKKSKKKEWKTRLDMLKKTVYNYIRNKPNKTIEVVNLFFDS